MSTAEVEQPSPIAQSSHHRLVTDGVELTGFRPAPRRTSLRAIMNIDVDDDNSAPERYARRSRRGQQSLMSTNDGPSATVTERSPVIVIEDAGDRGTRNIRRASNGAQNQPIVVLDSDEEQGQSSEAANSSFRLRHGGVRRRGGGPSSSSFRIFSPPPLPQQHLVPPVPLLPPIIADPVPFAILPPPVNNGQPRNRLPFDQPPQSINTSAAHGSNNNGNGIQLGGGLFSQGNGSARRHVPRAQVRFQPRRSEGFDEGFEVPNGRPPLERASRMFSRLFASYLSGNTLLPRPPNHNPSNTSHGQSGATGGGVLPHQPHHARQDIDAFDWGGEGEEPLPPSAGFFGLAAFSGLGPWGRRDVALGLGPDYDSKMTHPERAGPGWSYDFGTEQEEGRSKADGSEILVCAKCLDPLLANADGMVDVSAEEKKGRRVWSLRCGHVVDGKCVGTLMRPEGERDLSSKDVNSEDNNKGKEKQVNPEHSGENVVDELVTSRDVKGKGRAPATPIRAPTPPPLDNGEKMPLTPLVPEPGNILPLEDTSIRSRLRSRRSTVAPSSTVGTTSSSSRRSARHPLTLNSRGGPSSTRRRGTKRKRTTNAATEIVEERYEWTCPVSGCGRMHISVKVGGLWKMDSEYGAVAIFV